MSAARVKQANGDLANTNTMHDRGHNSVNARTKTTTNAPATHPSRNAVSNASPYMFPLVCSKMQGPVATPMPPMMIEKCWRSLGNVAFQAATVCSISHAALHAQATVNNTHTTGRSTSDANLQTQKTRTQKKSKQREHNNNNIDNTHLTAPDDVGNIARKLSASVSTWMLPCLTSTGQSNCRILTMMEPKWMIPYLRVSCKRGLCVNALAKRSAAIGSQSLGTAQTMDTASAANSHATNTHLGEPTHVRNQHRHVGVFVHHHFTDPTARTHTQQ